MSLTASHAHVRVNVLWPTRGIASGDRAYLSGFSATIHLARGADGRWIFVKQDPTVIVG